MTHWCNAKVAAKIAECDFISVSDTQQYYHSENALPLLIINTEFCHAVIALQGAQLLSFQPKNDKPWLWLSPLANFSAGNAIRGGIPLCFPWFGVNQQDPTKPKHGFVRNCEWQLVDILSNKDSLDLTFSHAYDGNNKPLFASPFSLLLTIKLSQSIVINIEVQNQSSTTENFSWAFHTYFAVNNIASTSVSGLENAEYLDNTHDLQRTLQRGDLVFINEVDRVFTHTQIPQGILSQHKLSISGENCPTCIVWNPGESVAQTIHDIKAGYKEFICVERGCAFSDSLCLAPLSVFNSTMTISKKI